MSSTITSGKCAAAFKKPNGAVVYVLFEKTHDTNVTPHEPRWGCFAIGEYADVMRSVFVNASSCESGGLQGGSKRLIKPENYIAGWRKELSNPCGIENKVITLTMGDNFYSTFKPDRLNEVRVELAKIDRLDVFADLQTGQSEINLFEDADVVQAIFGYAKFSNPWKILAFHNCHTLHHPELGIETRIGKIDPPVCEVRKINAHDLLVQCGSNGQWVNWGYAYASVGRYIIEVAYAQEMKQSGSSKNLITEFRELCASASNLSGDTMLTFYRLDAVGVKNWQLEYLDKFAQEFGVVESGQPAPVKFTVKFADIKNSPHGMYYLQKGYLHETQVSWHLPTATSHLAITSNQQLDLLAA